MLRWARRIQRQLACAISKAEQERSRYLGLKNEEDEGPFRRSLSLLVRSTEGITLVSQVRQSKQPVIDLNTVVYL